MIKRICLGFWACTWFWANFSGQEKTAAWAQSQPPAASQTPAEPPADAGKAAELAFDQARYKEAVGLFQTALQAQPERIYWLRLLAESYQYLGQFAQAHAVLKAGLERFPNHPLLLEGLGWLKLFESDFSGAEFWLRKALKEEPDGFWIQLNLAYALLFQAKESAAFQLLCQLGRSPEGPSLGTAMKKDFAKLRKFQITHPHSAQLTEQFTSRCGLGLVLPEACASAEPTHGP